MQSLWCCLFGKCQSLGTVCWDVLITERQKFVSSEIKLWGWLSAHPSQCSGFSEPVPSQCGEAPGELCLEECLSPFLLAACLWLRQSSHPKSIHDTSQMWKSLGISIWEQMSLISTCYFGQGALHWRRGELQALLHILFLFLHLHFSVGKEINCNLYPQPCHRVSASWDSQEVQTGSADVGEH